LDGITNYKPVANFTPEISSGLSADPRRLFLSFFSLLHSHMVMTPSPATKAPHVNGTTPATNGTAKPDVVPPPAELVELHLDSIEDALAAISRGECVLVVSLNLSFLSILQSSGSEFCWLNDDFLGCWALNS
jgi:hypothetical protein